MDPCDKCGSIGLSGMCIERICDDICVIVCINCLEAIVAELREDEEIQSNEMFGYMEM